MALPPEKPDPKKTTPTRIAIWVFVAGVAVYFIVMGIIGVIHNG